MMVDAPGEQGGGIFLVGGEVAGVRDALETAGEQFLARIARDCAKTVIDGKEPTVGGDVRAACCRVLEGRAVPGLAARQHVFGALAVIDLGAACHPADDSATLTHGRGAHEEPCTRTSAGSISAITRKSRSEVLPDEPAPAFGRRAVDLESRSGLPAASSAIPASSGAVGNPTCIICSAAYRIDVAQLHGTSTPDAR
jgi:hypothetical protein